MATNKTITSNGSLFTDQSSVSTTKIDTTKTDSISPDVGLMDGEQSSKVVVKNNIGNTTSVQKATTDLFADQSQNNLSKTNTQKTTSTSSNDISLLVQDKHYTHDQGSPSNTWVIQHNLDKHPSITIVDTAGSVLYGSVDYIDNNNVSIVFNTSFSGLAYLN
jgi:hypothetical protein